MVLGLSGIFLSLGVLLVLAYRGHSVIIVAPIAALLATLLSGAPLLATYTQIFMPALGGFIISFFPLFLSGAIFGRLMTSSGLAADLARGISALFGPQRAILSTVLATALLTYGGVSAWVVAFTIVPIATPLFRQAGIPKRLMPAALALGTITFAIAALPGSPQVHNVIPTRYFGTTGYAAPVVGLIGSIAMFALGMAWLNRRARALIRAGEPFGDDEPEDTTVSNTEHVALRGLRGLLPIAVVIVMNFLFIYVLSDAMDFSYLDSEKYGSTTIDAVRGLWSVVVALATGILLIMAMRFRHLSELVADLSEGAKNAILPALTTASEVGYGAVVASLAVFAVLRDAIFELANNAILVGITSVAAISGVTGSSSGGLSITLEAFGPDLAALAAQQNIDPELLHRLMAMASVSFDSLPHNGAVLTMLLVCGMTHRQSYKDIAVVSVAIPIVVLTGILGWVMLLG
ncbi:MULTISPECIES: GntP family permease [Corynebacterium]|uniref:GntP family permease n=2 Tax=Corynebacteriaceae TaxID=1653 RepID=UPI00124DF531|nr:MULTISPECIES: GntP family permease [Corynebacterium]